LIGVAIIIQPSWGTKNNPLRLTAGNNHRLDAGTSAELRQDSSFRMFRDG